MSHVHVITQCEHGVPMGGCKCMSVEGARIEVVQCMPPCRHAKGESGMWGDIYMGEPDAE